MTTTTTTTTTTQTEETTLINKVRHIYQRITNLDSLKPSATVDAVFSELVITCRAPTPSPLDLTTLTPEVSLLRTNLISLCSKAESLLESHFSNILLTNHTHPLHHLHLFPYYTNYRKLTSLETSLLLAHAPSPPRRVSFLGSGPLPLSSILMASLHFTSSLFLNYDRDPDANRLASTLLREDEDLKRRVVFRTAEVREVGGELKGCDVVFLAALVGMEKGEKAEVIRHLWRNMDVGSLLVVRSARGARGFLYPVVDAAVDLIGFDLLCQHDPDDEVINSVLIARRR